MARLDFSPTESTVRFSLRKPNTEEHIHFDTSGNCSVDMFWKDNVVTFHITGKDEFHRQLIILNLWEICALYDGYFYKVESYFSGKDQQGTNSLYKLNFYHTTYKPFLETFPLGGPTKNITDEILNKYYLFRNDGNMPDSYKEQTRIGIVNTFYYLNSTSYENVLIDHRLSMMLNICDGLIIDENFGKAKDISKNLKAFVDKADLTDILREGCKILGVSSQKSKIILRDIRNSLDHYMYKSASASAIISEGKADNSLYEFIVYLINLSIRIYLLNRVGGSINQEAKEAASKQLIEFAHKRTEKKVEQKEIEIPKVL